MSKLKWALNGALAVTLFAGSLGLTPGATQAASHREAPLISMDPTADITDFFMFRSYEPGREDNVVLVMDVMSEEPSSGPNYWNFDPNVLYRFNIDNDADGKADDIAFEFKFETEYRGIVKDLGLFLSYVALPPITALDGPGSEGLGLRQHYTVTMVKGRKRTVLAEGLFAVPSNVGPRTMPNYEALAAQGLYELRDGIRVFAGQRDDPFYIDLGAVFDTLNLRAPGTDMLSGFNVHTIALEVPAHLLTYDGKSIGETECSFLGAYASTSRRATTVLRGRGQISTGGRWVQVQRLANPLINEAIIGTVDKDYWNSTNPADDAQFLEYYQNLRLNTALEAVFGADAEPLLPNLGEILLTYGGEGALADLLRLDLRVAPTALANQDPLTVLGGNPIGSAPDPAGWPNGRRPIDDVTDVAIRVIGGANYLTASDSVQANDRPLPNAFPFLATPHDGRNRVHANP